MNLVQAIRDKVEEIDAASGNKQAAVQHFKAYVPDLSRQKLNAWLKNGKFPFELANGFFEQEYESAPPGPAPAAPAPPPWVDAPYIPETPRPLTAADLRAAADRLEQGEPDPTSEFTDASYATLPPNMLGRMNVGSANGKPLPESATNKLPQYRGPAATSRRTPDIQRLERRTSVQDQDYDPVLEAQIIEILHKLGVAMPALDRRHTEVVPAGPELLGAHPRPKFRQRSWNAPPQAK